MAVPRKRFSSVCSSSSAEEDSASLHDSDPISATDPPSEQEHPYASLLCCHRVQDSLLSSNSSFTRYRGILNWIIILLILTHAHLFLENFIQHGFLIDVKKVMEHLIEDNCNWPSVNLILASNIFAITALLLERFQEKDMLSPTNAHCLHLTNLGLLLLFPAAVIVHEPTISTGGAFFSLWFYTALGMKLYSYQETNRWYRQAHLTNAETDKNVSVAEKAYNEHLTFRDLYYFLLAPTLCYQRDFPCTPKVRINKLLHRLLEMVTVIQIMVGIVQQWIEPIFQRSENSFSIMDITMRVEHLVGLVAPTHFLWLLFFFLSHSYLNFCAELLRFGDRHFYGDWWNATTLIAFWNNWNIPFQKWCHRHVYTRLVEKNVPPSRAELMVFLMSAALCEYMIALPLHSCRLWILLMMVFELLVAVFLGNYFKGNYGNGLVWLCLLLGPLLAVITYFHDHYISFHHHHHQPSSSPLTPQHGLPSTVFLLPH
ncbi:diacylglycerol O-acyltransferase 1-like isoform X1 [Micropterus salmoides]|uniref:diacylglycerol O-acyltransferase 1-like isoform X1 n=1 Tax=Micropterus salmoides TaxID=27706 RepID=UPI0018ECD989|nr:diacylglycerol O-acyltransferase 1-like isoform X1 [Micropterus salmoides]XP_038561805.1 diacylglycerol O-acyltransferase 1-like isoform X1 [Micropterus salmoides]